ncbi:hypothetical protein [Thiolapillus sp.]
MKNLLLACLCILFLGGCSPHPSSGIWKAEGDNKLGIKSLTVDFGGKAVFTSSKVKPATWHCFWSNAGEQTAEFDCTPSTNTEMEERFVFTVKNGEIAELSQDGELIGRFLRAAGNPIIP